MLIAGKFEVVRELGRGAFGIVYEARDRYLDRAVAIKTIRDDFFTSASSRDSFEKRFLREARSVARLQHPNIIAVYEAGRDGEMSFIAMEFVRGKTLRDVLAARQRLPVADVVALAESLLSALDYAHGQGIVHRDIKPENVMIREDGMLKVADFGIAKALHAESTTLTKDGAVMGTPSYMPPEQITGTPVDGRADMFSSAAMLYECLVGEKPFAADNLPALVHQILTATPRPVPPMLHVPPHVAAAIMRGLAKEPDQRFRTCAEMLATLKGAGGAAPPPPARTRTTDVHRTVAAPGGQTFQGVLAHLPDPHAATMEATAATAPGRGALVPLLVAGGIFAVLLLLAGGGIGIYFLTKGGGSRPVAPRTVAPSPVASRTLRTPAPSAPARVKTPVPVAADDPPEVAPVRRPAPGRREEPEEDAGPVDDGTVAERAKSEIDAMAAVVRHQIESGNWNNLADHYTSNAVIVNSDGTFQGRSTIDSYYRTGAAVLLATAPGQPIEWSYRWIEFESDGTTAEALTQNHFSVGGVVLDQSIYRNRYRKTGSRWLIESVEVQGDGGGEVWVDGDGITIRKKKKKGADDEEDDTEIDIKLLLPRGLPIPGR